MARPPEAILIPAAHSERADKPTQIDRVGGSNLAQVFEVAAESFAEAITQFHPVGSMEPTAPPFSLRELSESGRPEPPQMSLLPTAFEAPGPRLFLPELAYITREFSDFLDEVCGSQSDRAALSLERAPARCAAGGIRPKGEK